VSIAHLAALRTQVLSGGRLLALYEASVTGKLLNSVKPGDVFYFVENRHRQNDSDSGHGAQKIERLAVVRSRLRDEKLLFPFDGRLEVINRGNVKIHVTANNRSIEVLGNTFAASPVGNPFLERRQIVLIFCELDVPEEFSPHSDQTRTAAKQITCGPHRLGVGVGARKHSPAQENRDLLRVDAVILGLSAVDGFHVERMAEHEFNAFVLAKITEPVPAKDALARDNQSVPERVNGLQKSIRTCSYILVELDASSLV